MIQPGEHILGTVYFCTLGYGGPVYHQYRHTQSARGDELGFGAFAARILAYHQIDAMRLHQGCIPFGGEWPAIDDQAVSGQEGRMARGVDEAQQIMMLWLGGKGFHMHSPQSQHDAAGRSVQRGHCAVQVGDADPAVAGNRSPCRASEGEMRDTGQSGRLHRMRAHRCGKGMGRVHQMRDAMRAQILDQSGRSAEAADTHRHGLGKGVFRPASIAERRGDPLGCENPGEHARFGRATQQKDIRHG